MPISEEAYAAFQSAVGTRFVSRDPASLHSVCWNGAVGGLPYGHLVGDADLPLAVVMPATVEEVAAVVKACNRFKLNFRAFSVGWLTMGVVTRPNSICIDLRRMNSCEIDERNMIATIQPYVNAGQLMAEAMKRGLTCHVVGAGATHSPLASATSGWGIGISGSTTGHNARNLLSLEWVTPKGEIVRIGSAGSGLDWGISDGPGPGFRGMIRGFIGAMGGIGVFTKIGYRLHPWHGPKKLEYTGTYPQVGIKIGDNFVRFYHAVWPTWEQVQKATFELNTSGVATVQVRMPPESIGQTLTPTNNDYLRQLESENTPEIARQENGCSWSILTTAYSAKHDAYNDKVVRHIVDRTGGRLVDVAQPDAELMARGLATSALIPRVLRPAAKLNTSFGNADSFRLLAKTVKATEEVYAQHDFAKTHLHSVGPEQNWIWPTERRTLWIENIIMGEEAAFGPMFEYLFRHEKRIEDDRLGYNAFLVGPAMDLVAPRWGPNAHLYQRKVKNAYDPHNLSDPFLYITPKPMPLAWGWKIAKKVLFRAPFRPVLKAVTSGPAKKKEL